MLRLFLSFRHNSLPALIAVLCALGGLAWANPAMSAPYMQPGFRSIGIWDETRGIRLDLAVWYPVTRPPRDTAYGNWTLSVSRGNRPIYGLFPLLIISHDSLGSRFSHHNLAADLCKKGYIVVAPTHRGDNEEDMSRMFSARQITGRVDEVRMSIDRILEDLDIGPSVDTSRIALLGFGSGATTALLMAGARLEGEYFAGYCDVAANSDPYCTPWTRPRMEQLANDPSVKASFKDERVKLVAAISPAFGMLFVPESLDRINMPIFLVRMGNDRLNASPRYIEGLRAHLPSSSLYGVLENSSPTLLMAPCSTLSRYGGASIECTPEIIKQQEALYHALSEKLAEFIGSMGRATLPPPSKTGARSKPDRRAKDTETAPVKTENAVKTPASE